MQFAKQNRAKTYKNARRVESVNSYDSYTYYN